MVRLGASNILGCLVEGYTKIWGGHISYDTGKGRRVTNIGIRTVIVSVFS